MIARKSFLIVSTSFFIDFLGWIGIVILAKLWGGFAPQALGIIGFAMSFVSIFNVITDFGFSTAHIKRVSEGKDLGRCIGTFAVVKIFLTVIMVVSTFVFLYISKNFLQIEFVDATTYPVVIVIVFQTIFANLQSIVTQTFIGKRQIAKLQITLIFENLVKIPLSIIVALAGVSALGLFPIGEWPVLQPLQRFISEHAVGSLAMTYLFGAMAVFFVGFWLMRKYPLKRPNWELFKSYFRFASPIMITSFVATISNNVDKLFIGYFGTSVEVAYYFTVQRVLAFITIFSSSVGTVLFPSISAFHAEKDYEKMKKTVRQAERYISMVMIPPVIFIFIFVQPIIKIILDEAFLPAAPVLVILTVWALVKGLAAPYSSYLSGMDRPEVGAKLTIFASAVNIVLDYLAIPENGILSPFGLSGPTAAAFIALISYCIIFIGLRIMARKLTGIKLLQSHTPRHIIAGGVMGIVLYYIAYQTPLLPLIRWYTLLGFAAVGLCIYIAALYLLKEFSKKDLDFFLNIIRPKEMLKYMKSEIKE